MAVEVNVHVDGGRNRDAPDAVLFASTDDCEPMLAKLGEEAKDQEEQTAHRKIPPT